MFLFTQSKKYLKYVFVSTQKNGKGLILCLLNERKNIKLTSLEPAFYYETLLFFHILYFSL